MSRHAPCTKESKSGVSERIPSYRGIMAKKKTRQKGPEGRRRKGNRSLYNSKRDLSLRYSFRSFPFFPPPQEAFCFFL